MKKIFLFLCVFFVTVEAFSETLVYKWLFIGPKYDMQSGENGIVPGNNVVRQTYYGYLVLQFDPAAKIYQSQRLVMYWTSDSKKYRKTLDYPAIFSVNNVTPTSNGFTFMKMFTQSDWDNISFEFTSARKQGVFNRTPDAEQKNPIIIDKILRGHRIISTSNKTGNTLNYGKISAKFDTTLTKLYLNSGLDSAVAGIENMLDQSGYNQWTE